MIERLVTSLRALASSEPSGARLLADAADAVRLELDCPQMTLTAEQRDALHGLDDLLEPERSNDVAIAEAARRALRALGIMPAS